MVSHTKNVRDSIASYHAKNESSKFQFDAEDVVIVEHPSFRTSKIFATSLIQPNEKTINSNTGPSMRASVEMVQQKHLNKDLEDKIYER